MVKKLIIGLILIASVGCLVPCQGYSLDKPADVNWYNIQSAQISVYFPTSGSDPAPTIASIYNSANNTIDIAIYSITNPVIVDAIKNAKQRGIKVRIISDRQESKSLYQSAMLRDLSTYGIPIIINSHSGLMHMKLSLVDKTFAMIGSYNYTQAASQTNDEIMIVCTEPMTIKTCQEQFDKMWADNKGFTKYGGD